jgi:hypothetical protein
MLLQSFFVAILADTILRLGIFAILSSFLLAHLFFSYIHSNKVYQPRLRSVVYLFGRGSTGAEEE